MEIRYRNSLNILTKVLSKYRCANIVVTWSGGKDSTTALLLVSEALKALSDDRKVNAVNVNTGVEIPLLRKELDHIREDVLSCTNNIDFVFIEPEKGFFYYLLVKGYKPPTPLYRWCLKLLKQIPLENFYRKLSGDFEKHTIVVTGSRAEESDRRRNRLSEVMIDSRRRIVYVVPLLQWSVNDVWTFLEMKYPRIHHRLKEIYRFTSAMRYGCWCCTVVRRDRALEMLCEEDERYCLLYGFKEYLRVLFELEEKRLPLGYRVCIHNMLLNLLDNFGELRSRSIENDIREFERFLEDKRVSYREVEEARSHTIYILENIVSKKMPLRCRSMIREVVSIV